MYSESIVKKYLSHFGSSCHLFNFVLALTKPPLNKELSPIKKFKKCCKAQADCFIIIKVSVCLFALISPCKNTFALEKWGDVKQGSRVPYCTYSVTERWRVHLLSSGVALAPQTRLSWVSSAHANVWTGINARRSACSGSGSSSSSVQLTERRISEPLPPLMRRHRHCRGMEEDRREEMRVGSPLSAKPT